MMKLDDLIMDKVSSKKTHKIIDFIFILQHFLVYFSVKWNLVVTLLVLLKLTFHITGVRTVTK